MESAWQTPNEKTKNRMNTLFNIPFTSILWSYNLRIFFNFYNGFISNGVKSFRMNSSFQNFIVAISVMVSIAPFARGQNDCELKKEKDDLKVYTCASPDSKLKRAPTNHSAEG